MSIWFLGTAGFVQKKKTYHKTFAKLSRFLSFVSARHLQRPGKIIIYSLKAKYEREKNSNSSWQTDPNKQKFPNTANCNMRIPQFAYLY